MFEKRFASYSDNAIIKCHYCHISDNAVNNYCQAMQCVCM